MSVFIFPLVFLLFCSFLEFPSKKSYRYIHSIFLFLLFVQSPKPFILWDLQYSLVINLYSFSYNLTGITVILDGYFLHMYFCSSLVDPSYPSLKTCNVAASVLIIRNK